MNVAPPAVEVRPGFWWYVAALACVGAVMSGTAGVRSAAGQLAYSLLFAASSVAFLFLHETGHVLGGALVGMTWTRMTFALGRAAVEMDTSGAVTNRQRFWSTLAGPVTQAAVSICCLTVVDGRWWGPAGFAATLSLIEAAVNLLLPLPGLDCHQLMAAGRHVVCGRGHLPQTTVDACSSAETSQKDNYVDRSVHS